MGVTFDIENNCFVFDFEHDGVSDVIHLTGNGYQVEAFGKCFYYGYEFSNQVSGSVRSEFIKYVKFSDSIVDNENLTKFIQKAINNLHTKINLYDYDLVIMPESSSKVNQYMLRYIYRFSQPSLQYLELVKSIPESISFDIDAYEKQYLNSDGRLCEWNFGSDE